MTNKKIVLAITGASGSIYPKIFLDFIRNKVDIKCFVTATKNAHKVFELETGQRLIDFWPDLESDQNFDVPYVSGSAKIDSMIILPCSMGMIGRIANGVSDCSITRTADVFLKERRKLILTPRETPFNLIHLENMTKLTQAGATILPANPSFYSHQTTVESVASSVVSRILDHLSIENNLMERWKED